MNNAFNQLVQGMVAGRTWDAVGDSDRIRELLGRVYDERFHSGAHYKSRFQVRVNMQTKADAASYTGWITAENPTSGPYQGTSFVWFPGETGSVAVLVIGTDGFGADTHILGRPGHGRRLRALSRLSRGKLWVKPDLLDLASQVPDTISKRWPEIPAALKSYSHVIYAAVPITSEDDGKVVADLIDLFFHEHQIPFKGGADQHWRDRLQDIAGTIFPQVDATTVLELLRDRRFVILEGPPGTGKTRLAYQIAERIGSSTRIQFHPARTYEDFVVGLYPKPVTGGLAFEVKPGDLLRANKAAANREHLLLIDEVNRADLGKVLGEAIVLFETGETRSVELPHQAEGFERSLALSPHLMVLGTRNTADRTIARMDLAIRRRFAFVDVWPDRQPVRAEGVELAQDCFDDTVLTFAEYADDETLRLVPGHSYFLDPRPDLAPEDRVDRIARRLRLELVPLLREYLTERLCGGASQEIAGLADRVESRVLER